MTVKLNDSTDINKKIFEPFAATASQHYYGQTLQWKETGNGPGNQDQDYFGKSKSGDRPIIYIARGAHATYFRSGIFPTDLLSNNNGRQYRPLEADDDSYDITRKGDIYGYTLKHLQSEDRKNGEMVKSWKGHWGEFGRTVLGHGPRSPWHRHTGIDLSGDSFIYLLRDPKNFHNTYLKDTQRHLYIE